MMQNPTLGLDNRVKTCSKQRMRLVVFPTRMFFAAYRPLPIRKPLSIESERGFLRSCRCGDRYFTWTGVQVGSTQPFQIFLVSFAFFMILSSSLGFFIAATAAFFPSFDSRVNDLGFFNNRRRDDCGMGI